MYIVTVLDVHCTMLYNLLILSNLVTGQRIDNLLQWGTGIFWLDELNFANF